MDQNTMTTEQLEAEIARLKAVNAELKAKERAKFKLKVSEKGAVSVYGLGRFPVTLYSEQWSSLLANAAEIIQFCKANELEITRAQKAHAVEKLKAEAQAEVEKVITRKRG